MSVMWISMSILRTCNILVVDLNVDEDKLTQIYHTDSRVRFYVQYYGFSDRESYTYGGAISLNVVCANIVHS